MAETTTPFKFDKATFDKNVTAIKEFQMTFQGKRNHNPFLWLRSNLTPLEEKAATPAGQVKEVFDAVAKLAADKTIPIVNPNYKEPAPEATNPTPATGLKLPPNAPATAANKK